MTVDVEDYFQVQAFARCIDRSRWDEFPSHVEANTARMLELFDRHQVKATFFTLGWVAIRFPQIVRDIVAAGHELASHGYGHQLVHELSPEAFRSDLTRAKAVLEDVGGVEIIGYRAPTFSIGPRNPWAFDVLAETGHRYSSSVYPVKHDLYGAPGTPRKPYRPSTGSLLEIPMTTLELRGRTLPIAGGGYFRLMPYWLFRRALARFNRTEDRAGIFYIHPWEIDEAQPRIEGAAALARFRHHVNISSVMGRLQRMMHDFAWDRMDRVFAADLAAAMA